MSPRKKSEPVDDLGARQTSETVITESQPSEESITSRFRGWHSDQTQGYERLTDEMAGQIVLKFRDKPAQEQLEQLKSAGYRYQADYFGLRKVWTRRNDFEGRLRTEEIEKSLLAKSQGAEPGRE